MTESAHHGDRRVRRTKRMLRESFIELALEVGYDAISVEDITKRADIARPTFYAHYTDKDALLAELFDELATDLVTRLAELPLDAGVIHSRTVIGELYRHAEQHRDLYLICLGGAANGRARAAYSDAIAAGAEQRFAARLRSTKDEPQVPVSIAARAFAGAHTELLATWLLDPNRGPGSVAANQEAEVLFNGLAWALGLHPDDLIYEQP